MTKFSMVAPCIFGVEGLLADELKRMDAEAVTAENGRVLFSGGAEILARANIRSRLAERILINVGEFDATDFTALFDGTKDLPWENYIGQKDAFPVTGWSITSQLHSIPDCQAIIKKAIVERLKSKYKLSWFEETGPLYKIRFSIMKDKVTLMIDTSGDGLHKRGYRANSNMAPIKETLAAAMCNLARIFPDTQLYDPFCGSGTILIEAALMAKNMAPGLKRNFAAERFSFVGDKVFAKERTAALSEINNNVTFRAHGFDVDPAAVKLTLDNAKLAGVEGLISAEVRVVADFKLEEGRTLTITNPPYGERMLEIKNAEQLYKVMGQVMIREPGKKYFIISPHDDFESFFGRPADKRRKLYNGMIKCNLHMFFK